MTPHIFTIWYQIKLQWKIEKQNENERERASEQKRSRRERTQQKSKKIDGGNDGDVIIEKRVRGKEKIPNQKWKRWKRINNNKSNSNISRE